MGWLLAFLVALLAACLFLPVVLQVRASLETLKTGEAVLDIRALGGLLRIVFEMKLHIFSEPTMTLLRKKKGRFIRLWRLGEKQKKTSRLKIPVSLVWDAMKIEKIEITGEIGVHEDAFLTAMLAGALNTVFLCALFVLCAKKERAQLRADVRPAFQNACFRLNLAGIARCSLIHIITAIILWHVKNRKGQKEAWRILSKIS